MASIDVFYVMRLMRDVLVSSHIMGQNPQINASLIESTNFYEAKVSQ
jgi:hypothetical protein